MFRPGPRILSSCRGVGGGYSAAPEFSTPMPLSDLLQSLMASDPHMVESLLGMTTTTSSGNNHAPGDAPYDWPWGLAERCRRVEEAAAAARFL